MPIRRPRIAAISRLPIRARSRPSKQDLARVTRPGASSSWMIERPSVDFPDPLSPTTPSTSPRRRSKLDASTAWIAPPGVGKTVVRSRTLSSGVVTVVHGV